MKFACFQVALLSVVFEQEANASQLEQTEQQSSWQGDYSPLYLSQTEEAYDALTVEREWN